jgi:hypothetical protein
MKSEKIIIISMVIVIWLILWKYIHRKKRQYISVPRCSSYGLEE